MVRQGGALKVYENGILAGTNTISANILAANATLTIGQAEGIGYVNGLMDEMTIYNRALSGAEIAAIYSAGGAGKCKGDMDQDGLPDWWEWKYFGNLAHTGSELDGLGDTLQSDYQSGHCPTFRVRIMRP